MYRVIIASILALLVLFPFLPIEKKFSEKEIRLGMSGPFSGSKKNLGKEFLKGAESYFKYINDDGGVYGRFIKVIHKDDRYEPKIAEENAKNLINQDKIFAFFGVIGTPTSKAILPIALKHDIPFLGAFSGARFLRKPPNPLILNARASYEEEAERLISYFVDYKKLTRIAVFYQNDSYGRSGLNGVRKALDKRNLKVIGEGSYKRNTLSVGNALYEISLTRPEAIILVASTMPAVEFIKRARRKDKIIKNIYFGALSFISPKLLVKGLNYETKHIIFSQVVPSPWKSRKKEVILYRELMSKYFPKSEFGFVSLEGYFAARMTTEVFRDAGADFTKSDFIKAMENLKLEIKNNLKSKKLSKRCGCLQRVHLSRYVDGDFKTIKVLKTDVEK